MKTRILLIIPALISGFLVTLIDCGQTQSDQLDAQGVVDLGNRCSADLSNSDVISDAACVIDYGMIRYYIIEEDMERSACAVIGCHHPTATSRFKIDRTAGKLIDNYNLLFTLQLVVKGDPDKSTLITVPATGKTASGAAHVRTLAGTRLDTWRSWVAMGAPF